MACKCKINCKYTILPLSIIIISLLQLYFQYSTFMTKRNQNLEKQDKRNQIYTFNFIFGRRYEFNLGEIDNYFNDNALMKITKLKNLVINGANKWNEKRQNKLNIKLYEIFYLIIYDLFFIIFLYLFIFKLFKAGIMKIIIQILKCVFTARRFKKNNPEICLCRIILNHFDNTYLRNSEIFDPEGYEIFEFLCNFVIVLDIIWLIIIKRDARKDKNDLTDTETNIVIKKQILTDENRVDYNKEGTIELKEEKIYSNENNKESDEDKDDDKDDNQDDDKDDDKDDDDNNNINNKDNDENDYQDENDKDDENNENINNNKDEDDEQENYCQNNNNYNNYNNSEVNNSFNNNKEKEEDENNEEEEEGIDEDQ